MQGELWRKQLWERVMINELEFVIKPNEADQANVTHNYKSYIQKVQCTLYVIELMVTPSKGEMEENC